MLTMEHDLGDLGEFTVLEVPGFFSVRKSWRGESGVVLGSLPTHLLVLYVVSGKRKSLSISSHGNEIFKNICKSLGSLE